MGLKTKAASSGLVDAAFVMFSYPFISLAARLRFLFLTAVHEEIHCRSSDEADAEYSCPEPHIVQITGAGTCASTIDQDNGSADRVVSSNREVVPISVQFIAGEHLCS